MHEQKNIYHRDLHNGNVLVGPDSTPYIIDFGRSVRSIGSEYAYDYTDKTGQNRIVLTSDEDRLNNIRDTLQVYTHQIAPVA